MMKNIVVMLVLVFLLSCSGERKPASLEEAFLNYNKGESVTFTITGNAACSECLKNQWSVNSLLIEIMPKDDPTHSLGVYPFTGLGQFSVHNIKAVKGQALTVEGKLMVGGDADTQTLIGSGEITAPDDEHEIIGLVINFPSD